MARSKNQRRLGCRQAARVGARRLRVEALEERRVLAVAGPFGLLKDIQAGGASNPLSLVNIGGELWFSAQDASHGGEIWHSDGTTEGTAVAFDMVPGPGSSHAGGFFLVGSRVYFAASGTFEGSDVYVTEGLEKGFTRLQADLGGTSGTYPTNFAELDGVLYFNGETLSGVRRLFRSDGTLAGTRQVLPAANASYPAGMITAGGKLFFSGGDSLGLPGGTQLWVTDGTDPGTELLKSLYVAPWEMTSVGETVYFTGATDGEGPELWKSDGTATGTVRVRYVSWDYENAYPQGLTNVGGVLYFTAINEANGRELWKTDGTAAGTVLVKDVLPGIGSSEPGSLTNVDGVLYFTANNGVNGRELWKSDGTAAGTVLVKDVRPGAAGAFGLVPAPLTNIGGTLYFAADDGVHGMELWRSDGTAAGTVLTADIAVGPAGSSPTQITQAGDRLYVVASTEAVDREIWVANLTPDVTGDFDVNCAVDGHDFLAWQRQLGNKTAPAGSRADASSNGLVDAADLALWRGNYGASEEAAVATAVSAPAEEELALLGGATAQASHEHAVDAIYAGGDFTQLFAPGGASACRPGVRLAKRAALFSGAEKVPDTFSSPRPEQQLRG